MLAWVVLISAAPSLLCFGSSAWLAYKERSQWIWFAGLAILAGFGGVWTLFTIQAWRLAAALH